MGASCLLAGAVASALPVVSAPALAALAPLSAEAGFAPAALSVAPASFAVLLPAASVFGDTPAVGPAGVPGAGGVASVIIGVPYSAEPPVRENGGTGERGISTLGIAADGITDAGMGERGIGFEGMADVGMAFGGMEEFGTGVAGMGLDGIPELPVDMPDPMFPDE